MSVGILATEATLNTLSVTVQALMVSGKQMTLAVFRQLPISRLISIDGSLLQKVNYWGRVRYCIKDEGNHWMVLELEKKLYRARLPAVDEYEWSLPSAKSLLAKTIQARDDLSENILRQRKRLEEGLHYSGERAGRGAQEYLERSEARLSKLVDEVNERQRELETGESFCKNARESLSVLHGLTQLFIAV